MQKPLHLFVSLNRRACTLIIPYLPQASARIFQAYEDEVTHCLRRFPKQVVLDIGGGARSSFASRLLGAETVIALDISVHELERNQSLQSKVAADASVALPFADSSADLVISRSVVEHLADVDTFLAETKRVLKSGGMSIHLFPSKWAPFSLINRGLPHEWSRRLLYWLQPSQRGIGGFPAYYHHCSAKAFHDALLKRGFVVRTMSLSYFQSEYFNFFLPLFLLSCAYEMAVRRLRLASLCAFVLCVAEKPEPTSTSSMASARTQLEFESVQ